MRIAAAIKIAIIVRMKKTNAMRILDGLKIKYETLSYDDDGEHELSRGAAEKTAEKLASVKTLFIFDSIFIFFILLRIYNT